jgi:hypothetical protein
MKLTDDNLITVTQFNSFYVDVEIEIANQFIEKEIDKGEIAEHLDLKFPKVYSDTEEVPYNKLQEEQKEYVQFTDLEVLTYINAHLDELELSQYLTH